MTRANVLALTIAFLLGGGLGFFTGTHRTLSEKQRDPPAPPGRRIAWPAFPEGRRREEALKAGRNAFVSRACWRCHKLGEEQFPGGFDLPNVGPDLTAAGARLSTEELVESIVNPNAVIAEPREKHALAGFSKMPLQEQITLGELTALVLFLSEQKSKK